MAILDILDHVIMNWDKKKQTAIFGSKILKFAYNSKTTWQAELKFRRSVGAYEWFMQTKLGALDHMNKILQAKNGQMLTNLNRYTSVSTNIDEN